jgi:hypothetical protein
MQTSADLRAQCRSIKEAIAGEIDPEAKQKLAQQGFALAQLAEKIERDELTRKRAPRLRA